MHWKYVRNFSLNFMYGTLYMYIYIFIFVIMHEAPKLLRPTVTRYNI